MKTVVSQVVVYIRDHLDEGGGLLAAGRNFFTIGDWELGVDMGATQNVICHALYRK